jgi:hypothetical protein
MQSTVTILRPCVEDNYGIVRTEAPAGHALDIPTLWGVGAMPWQPGQCGPDAAMLQRRRDSARRERLRCENIARRGTRRAAA